MGWKMVYNFLGKDEKSHREISTYSRLKHICGKEVWHFSVQCIKSITMWLVVLPTLILVNTDWMSLHIFLAIAATFVICWLSLCNLQTVWTQIRTDRMSVLIWIQISWYNDIVPVEFVFWKSKNDNRNLQSKLHRMSGVLKVHACTY